MRLKVFLLFVPLCFLCVTIEPAFGHGIGGETLPPVKFDERNVTIFLSVNPPTYEQMENEHEIVVKFFDADTGKAINDVTYLVELSKGEKKIFSDLFYDKLGSLYLKTKTTGSELKIYGKQKPSGKIWKADGSNPITIEGPIFTSGGLYNFHIKILTLESAEFLENPISFNAAISLAEKTLHDVAGSNEKYYLLGITSYYDNIENFEYLQDQRKISFSMPFDWKQDYLEQVSVVHMEVHIPKTFGDLLLTNYHAAVNGILLPERSVVIDDYSENDRIVHLILSQLELFAIKDDAAKFSQNMLFTIEPGSEVKLPLSSHTSNVQYQVDLWWDPPIIQNNQQTKFYVDIFELYVAVKEQKPVTYDFVLKQNGKELLRKTIDAQMNTLPKSFFTEYVFSNNNVGPVVVSIENINNQFLASADFMVVVEPQKTPEQKFPLRLESQTPTGVEGSYFVDLTWIPSPLEIFNDAEFIITIYDKKTEIPIPQAEYDFVLIKDRNEIARKSGLAKAGGSFENHRFAEKDLGDITLRIENIDQSQEFVEIPLSVTPEFPVSVFFVLVLSLMCLVFTTKFLRKKSILTF